LGKLASMNNKNNPAAGFSLLELMIILVITALLLQIAVPSYKTYIDRAHALQQQVNQPPHPVPLPESAQ